MVTSGASKGAKKVNAFNDGVLEGVNVANAGPSTPVGVYDTSDGGKMVMPKIQPYKIRKIKTGKA